MVYWRQINFTSWPSLKWGKWLAFRAHLKSTHLFILWYSGWYILFCFLNFKKACLYLPFIFYLYLFMGCKCNFAILIYCTVVKPEPSVHPSLEQCTLYTASNLPLSSLFFTPCRVSIVHHSTLCFHVYTLFTYHF